MASEWLLGSNGLYCGSPESGWQQVGAANYPVNAILCHKPDTIVGTEGGLWCVQDAQWIQWHDETMTLVQELAGADVGLGVVVASGYGLATGTRDKNQVPRWQWYSDDLPVNARYSNVVITDPDDVSRWLVGTEAGVWVCEENGTRWIASSLTDQPVRALCRAKGAFWAGADSGGVWCSVDGIQWAWVGSGLEDVPVYSLVFIDDGFLVGTEKGVAIGDGSGKWGFVGPSMRMREVNASESLWLAGGNPGGLWFSEDRGTTWQKSGDFNSVNVIVRREQA